MAISSTTSRIRYTGDAATSAYDYTFQIDSSSDLLVTVRSNASPPVQHTLTLTTDYTVSNVGTVTGGTVTLVNASQTWLTSGFLKSGWKIVLRRRPSILQSYDIRNQGDSYRETLENAADRVTMHAQQLKDETDRSVRLPETYISSDFNPVFPTDIDNADNRVPLVNSTGDGWADIEDWPLLTTINTAGAAFYVDGTYASPSAIAGSGTISFTTGYTKNKVYIGGSSGAQSAGNIQAGSSDGQELLLCGTSDANTVTIDTGGRISVNGTCILGAGQQITFNWDNGTGVWRETHRSH